MIFVDSNILLDIWAPDPVWAPWSQTMLRRMAVQDQLVINPIIYAEISIQYSVQFVVDSLLNEMGILVLDLPNDASFMAGKAFRQYRKQGGPRTNVLPDFFIGAHAAVLGATLLTRDTRRYTTYFPSIPLITP